MDSPTIQTDLRRKNIEISRGDYFLFGSSVVSLAAFALDHAGYSSQLLQSVLNVTHLATALGESFLTAPSLDRLYTVLPGLVFFGARVFIDSKAQSNHSLRIISLGLNAYGTCVLAKKAITEAVTCYHLCSKNKLSNLEAAKVCLIHGTNAIASFFRTYMTSINYQTLDNIKIIDTIASKAKKLCEKSCSNKVNRSQFNNEIDSIVQNVKTRNQSLIALGQLRDRIYKIGDLSPAGLRQPTIFEIGNNRITDDMGRFKPEMLLKLDPGRKYLNDFSSKYNIVY